jgi:hypothetical protein
LGDLCRYDALVAVLGFQIGMLAVADALPNLLGGRTRDRYDGMAA